MMNNLISRRVAIDAVYKCTDYYVGNLPVMIDKADAYKALADLPTVDAVPVVRCRNCKYVSKGRSPESARKFGQLYDCGLGVLASPKADDFCCYGKRREE